MDTIHQNMDLVRRYLAMIETFDESLIDELVHPDYYVSERRLSTRVRQETAAPRIRTYDSELTQLRGRETFMQRWRHDKERWNDCTVTINRMVANETEVWVDMDISGHPTGELFGIPVAGGYITYRAIFFYEVSEGKVISADGLYDHLSVLGQIGQGLFEENNIEKINEYFAYLREKGLLISGNMVVEQT
ncbi:MAG: ester cyclase [Candidatus Kariarchaeaceae archaeon]